MTEEAGGAPYRVALPEFEGPLDLLLHLCKTHEIEIVNIPIAFITEKYLEYLDVMQSMSLDLAADYLVMAATLAYLKSRELVPVPEPLEAAPDEEEGEALDPREELIRRLLEYQKYKDAAEQLGQRPIAGRNVFGRGMDVEGEAGPAPMADHSVWKLIEAFAKLLVKAGPDVAHEVAFDRISISARINVLVDRLEAGGGSFRFDSLFDLKLPAAELRSQLVVTLLAILELARLKVVRVLASDDQETLFITQVEGAALDQARRAHVTSAEHEGEGEGEGGWEAPPPAGDVEAAAPELDDAPQVAPELSDAAPQVTAAAGLDDAPAVSAADQREPPAERAQGDQ